jgi:glycosyltransferase involved in cell wall biosynthesis
MFETDRNVRILAIAYACEPGKGSEPGAGWIWSRMLACLGETWVITRSNNRPAIEEGLRNLSPNVSLRFVYVDLPAWARFWKRGQRGIRLYYLLWQIAALRRAHQLLGQLDFDLVWHLTLANAWLGSTGSLLPQPFVYGPVAAGPGMPWRLVPALGIRGTLYESLREVAEAAGRYVNPLARISWRRARLILAQNEETRRWIPRRHRPKIALFPNTVLEDFPTVVRRRRSQLPTALFAARLMPSKGGALAIRAATHLPEWRLLIAGRGPDEARLRRLARRLGVEDRVHFLGWLPRTELFRFMSEEADVFLYPSIREAAGWVVAEAIARDLPVVCLNRGGPPLLGGLAVAVTGQHETSRALADAVRAAFTRSAPPPRALATDADSSLKRLLDLLRDTSCFGGHGPAVDEGEDVAGGPWRKR